VRGFHYCRLNAVVFCAQKDAISPSSNQYSHAASYQTPAHKQGMYGVQSM
jgi:hypothetical protein